MRMLSYCALFIVLFGFPNIGFSQNDNSSFAFLVEEESSLFTCEDGFGTLTYQLTGDDPGQYTYYWTHGPQELSLSNLEPGTYTFVVTDFFGCAQTFTEKIEYGEECQYAYIQKKEGCCTELLYLKVLDQFNSTIPESELTIVWSDGSDEGLSRHVPRDTPGNYCVTITYQIDGYCCYVEHCFVVLADLKCADFFFPDGLIINELNRNADGGGQFVELLVVGNCLCKSHVDIRGFIIDDNNGYLVPGGSEIFGYNKELVGISGGFLAFSQNESWSQVPIGSLIVIYDVGSPLHIIPADDPKDSDEDLVYIVPVNNASYLTAKNGIWNHDDKELEYGGDEAVLSWEVLRIDETTDGVQVRQPGGEYFHGLGIGTSEYVGENNFSLYKPEVSSSNVHCIFHYTNYQEKDHYTCYSSSENLQTPGVANSSDNLKLLDQIKNCLLPGSTAGNGSSKREADDQVPVHPEKLTAFPNPFYKNISIEYEAVEEGEIEIEILDMAGRRIFQSSYDCKVGANHQVLEVGDYLGSGIFNLTYRYPSGHQGHVRLVSIHPE